MVMLALCRAVCSLLGGRRHQENHLPEWRKEKERRTQERASRGISWEHVEAQRKLLVSFSLRSVLGTWYGLDRS